MRSLILAALIATPVAAQSPEEVGQARRLIEETARCQIEVLLWNSGDRADLLRAYGKHAGRIVAACGIGNRARRVMLDEFLTQHPEALTPPR